MYKCCDCGCEFNEPGVISEVIGEYGNQPAEYGFNVCLNCKSEEIVEIDVCPITKEYKPVAEDYHEDAINWGDKFWTYICELIQRRWECDFKAAKEFLEYIVERNI